MPVLPTRGGCLSLTAIYAFHTYVPSTRFPRDVASENSQFWGHEEGEHTPSWVQDTWGLSCKEHAQHGRREGVTFWWTPHPGDHSPHLILRKIPDRSQLRGHLQKPQPASCQVTTYMGSCHHLRGLRGPEDCMSCGALCGVLHCKATVAKMKGTHIMCVS